VFVLCVCVCASIRNTYVQMYAYLLIHPKLLQANTYMDTHIHTCKYIQRTRHILTHVTTPQPRYGRQPTRLDVERCVPKIAPIKNVMDAVRAALESGMCVFGCVFAAVIRVGCMLFVRLLGCATYVTHTRTHTCHQ